MIRTGALVVASLALSSDASSNLRGNDHDALLRRLTAGECDPQGSPIWENLAITNGLDPNIWADKLYQTCVDDANGDLKSETITNGCWTSSIIAPWVGLMTWGNDPNLGCTSNEECRNDGGKCYYRYLASACTSDSSSMLPECGTVVANPDIANSSGGGQSSTTGAVGASTSTAAATTSASTVPTTSTTLAATSTQSPATSTTMAATSAAATTTTSSANLGTTTEDPCARRKLSGTCEPYTGLSDNIWVIIAEANGLDPVVYGPLLYAACMDSIAEDENGQLKTGLIQNFCFGPTEVMMFKIFTATDDLGCTQNADCGASTGICYYKLGLASCEKGDLMQPECGTAPVNPIIASDQSTIAGGTTQEATTVATTTQPVTTTQPASTVAPTTTQQATTVAPTTTQQATTVAPTTQQATTVAATTTEDPCGRRLEDERFYCDPQQFERITKASGLNPIKYTSGLYEACVEARGTRPPA